MLPVVPAAHAEGAQQGGREVRHVAVAGLAFPVLRSDKAWQRRAAGSAMRGR